MFAKGNTWGRGRPKISLSKPELLLPWVFAKASLNWANDFTRLYRKLREEQLTDVERMHLKFLMDIMPYLCTKVQLKEIDGRSTSTPADSAAQAKQTSKLLQALEAENASSKPTTESGQ